jgi:hypothetical protein
MKERIFYIVKKSKMKILLIMVACIIIAAGIVYVFAENKKGYDKAVSGLPTIIVTKMPTVAPSDAEESLDDFSEFDAIKNCFLDYKFEMINQNKDGDTELYITTEASYDLDTDGKDDDIKIGLIESNGNAKSYIQVNNAKQYFYVDDPNDGEVHVIDLDKNDKYLEIACFDAGPSGDDSYDLFRYDGTNIYRLGSIDAMALIDCKGKLISHFNYSRELKPMFCSAWYEIENNVLVQKKNDLSKYIGKTYEYVGGYVYYTPCDEMKDVDNLTWERTIELNPSKVKLLGFYHPDDVTVNDYFVEFPSGEKGILSYYLGD